MSEFMETVEDIQRRLGVDPNGDPPGQPGQNDYRLYRRIADLEAQVARLQWAFTEAHGYVDEEGFFLHDHPYHERWGLEPGDLDPTTDTPEMSG